MSTTIRGRATTLMSRNMNWVDGHHVRHHLSLDQGRDSLAVVITRSGEMHPGGLRAALRADVHAHLSLGDLDGPVHLALRHLGTLEDLVEVLDHGRRVAKHVLLRRQAVRSVPSQVRPVGHVVQALPDDLARLADLLHTDQEAVVDIGVVLHRHFEIHLLVGCVGLIFAQVAHHPGRPQRWPGDPPCVAVLRGEDAHSFSPLVVDAIVFDDALILRHPLG
jgi:hypothetical protein